MGCLAPERNVQPPHFKARQRVHGIEIAGSFAHLGRVCIFPRFFPALLHALILPFWELGIPCLWVAKRKESNCSSGLSFVCASLRLQQLCSLSLAEARVEIYLPGWDFGKDQLCSGSYWK